MRARIVGLMAVTATACAHPDAPHPTSRSAPTAMEHAPRALDAAAAPPSAVPTAHACRAASAPETIDDRGGRPDPLGTTRLENVRLLADGDAWIVTWERQSDFQVGDSWRAPVMATRSGAGAFVVRELPVHAYACATSGYAGVTALDAPLVAWGVVNDMGFQRWKTVPAVSKGGANETVKTPPASRRATPRQMIGGFVASRNVALATTLDLACDLACSCPTPAPSGLWTYDLADTKRPPSKLASSPTYEGAADAPALAMASDRGVAAWRAAGALHLAWLDGGGAPLGATIRVDAGDVGAPALAIAGTHVVVAWARRDAKGDPYALRWVLVEHGASALPASSALPTTASAFAPAVLTDGADAVLAWTEGDGGARGSVLAARIALRSPAEAPRPVQVSTGDERNARDPELGGSVDAPVVAYGAFSAARPGGVVRVARLACDVVGP